MTPVPQVLVQVSLARMFMVRNDVDSLPLRIPTSLRLVILCLESLQSL